jgi:hypothetical protein
MKKLVIVVLHILLGLVFGLAVSLYTADTSKDIYGGYQLALLLFVLLPLALLGICFVFCVPHPQKWLPWIGLGALWWEMPGLFFSVNDWLHSPFPYPDQIKYAGAAVAGIACCITIWQGFYLYRAATHSELKRTQRKEM